MSKSKEITIEVYSDRIYDFYSALVKLIFNTNPSSTHKEICNLLSESIVTYPELTQSIKDFYIDLDEKTENVLLNIYKSIEKASNRASSYKLFIPNGYDDFKKSDLYKGIAKIYSIVRFIRSFQGKGNTLEFKMAILNFTNSLLKEENIKDDNIEVKSKYFKMWERYYLQFINVSGKKKDEIIFRTEFIGDVYNELSDVRGDISNHIAYTVTGIVLAEFGILDNEEQHFESNRYGSYNKYLRNTVYNVIEFKQ